MRSVELLAFGVDERLGTRLSAWSQDRGLWYQPVRHVSALRNLLRKGSRGILLLPVGRDLLTEMTLLRETSDHFPHITSVVWCDADEPVVEGLAYDLGARAVILPPLGIDELIETLEKCETKAG